MKNKLLLLVSILFIPFIVNAEQINMEWQTLWGGNGTTMLKDFFIKEKEILFFGVLLLQLI